MATIDPKNCPNKEYFMAKRREEYSIEILWDNFATLDTEDQVRLALDLCATNVIAEATKLNRWVVKHQLIKMAAIEVEDCELAEVNDHAALEWERAYGKNSEHERDEGVH